MEPNNSIPLMPINTNNDIQNERPESNENNINSGSDPNKREKINFLELKCLNISTTTNFIIVFSIINVLQGAIRTYLNMSIKQTAFKLGYDQYNVEWFLTTIGLTQGAFILILTFYLQRFNPMRSISVFILIEVTFCIINIFQKSNSFTNPLTMNQQNTINSYSLCERNIIESEKTSEENSYIIQIPIYFFIQIIISLTDGIIYCIGLSYIYDNSKTKIIPLLFGIVLGSYVLGREFGIIIFLNIESKSLENQIVWLILIILLIFFSICICFFPKKLKKIITNNLYMKEFTFIPSIKRLLTNKILMLNIFALVFLEIAIINYSKKEENYIKSRFYIKSIYELNGILNDISYKYLFIILRSAFLSIIILFSGFIISNYIKNFKILIIWNIIIDILISLLFIIYIFINCSNLSNNKKIFIHSNKNIIVQPFCSIDCTCNNVKFIPVCVSDETYFSPCHAGCQSIESIDNVIIYKNCSCNGDINEISIFNGTAIPGPCNNENCQILSIIYEILILIGEMLLGTCIIGRLIITLKNTLPQDKSLSLALQLTISGIVVNIPGKLFYDYIENLNCDYWSDDSKKTCLLHNSTNFGDILNTISAVFIIFATILDLLIIVIL